MPPADEFTTDYMPIATSDCATRGDVCASTFARLAMLLSLLLGACASPLPKQQTSTPASAIATAAPLEAATAAPPTAPSTPPAAAPAQTSAAPIEPARQLTSAQKAALLRRWVEQQRYLYDIAAPLLLANTDLCERHRRDLLGFIAKTRHSFGEDFAEAAEGTLGLDERLRVMGVLPGSGAQQAGLREGDVLLAVEIEPLPTGPLAERDGAALIAAEMRDRDRLALSVLRGDEHLRIDVPLTPACAMVVNLGDSDRINSYADGNRILITRGMLEYAANERELAYVVAREVAHNILARGPREDMAQAIDRLRTLELKARNEPADNEPQPYSPVSDATADKLALYLLVRAGYDYEQALPFWRRLASKEPGAHGYLHTQLHPHSGYRFSVMAEVARVIKSKQQLRLPLLP